MDRLVTLAIAAAFLAGGYWLGLHAERPIQPAIMISGAASPCQGSIEITPALPDASIQPMVHDYSQGWMDIRKDVKP